MEETSVSSVSPRHETTNEVEEAPPNPVSNDPPKVVKEAEHKLKEMSRKAKERSDSTRHRGTVHNASKQKALSEINYFWLVIGGLGALGVGYLVFGPGRREPAPKPRQRFKFVPKPKTPEKVPVQPSASGQSPREDEEKSVPKFELNCF